MRPIEQAPRTAFAAMKSAVPFMLLLMLIVRPGVAAADLSQAAEFNIAPQQLNEALLRYCEQSGVQVTSPSTILDGKSSAGVVGTFAASEALEKLLAGTALDYAVIDQNTVAIRERKSAGKDRVSKPAGDGNVVGGMRLVQTDSDIPAPNAAATEAATSTEESDQNGRRKEAEIETIIVTAQKREERLQDVPMSITVLSGDDLDRDTSQGVTEALSRVPGVAVEESIQGGTTQVTIRGVSAAYGTNFGASPVGYYLDAVPFGFVRSATTPDPDVYDLDRIEVLRGPQGTLYGASSVNGVVRVLTKDANLDRFELKARALTSNSKHGDWNYRGDLAVNAPIIDGKLAARAVIGYQDLAGWIDRPDKKDANDAERLNARLKLKAQPNEQLSVGLSAWISRSDFGAPNTADGNFRDFANDVEPQTTDFETYALKIDYDFPAFSLTSATSYIDYFNEGDQVNAEGTASVLYTEMSAETFAQEINLTSTHEGPWRWTAGAIYRDGEDKRFNTLFIANLGSQDVNFLSESWAVLGELTRSFLDGQLELTGGLRYFEDEVGLREDLRFGPVQPAAYISRSNTFRSTTPRIVLTWRPEEDLTVYASYSEGFRSGADQLPSILAAVNIPAIEPDLLKNYELGAKGTLWGGRVGFDAAVYDITWEDVQLPLVVEVDGIGRGALLNGQSASGIGADFALTVSPAEKLELGANFSWNDITVDADARAGTIIAYGKGDRLNASPEYTIGATADYSFPIGGYGWNGHLAAAFNVTSPREFRTLAGTQVLAEKSDFIRVGRASFAVDSPDGWSATLFVDNINNESGAVTRAFTVGGLRPDNAIRIRPRTIGVQLDYRFGR